jgi:hypothetical protein
MRELKIVCIKLIKYIPNPPLIIGAFFLFNFRINFGSSLGVLPICVCVGGGGVYVCVSVCLCVWLKPQLLLYFSTDLDETWHKARWWYLDVHVVRIFRFVDFCKSYGLLQLDFQSAIPFLFVKLSLSALAYMFLRPSYKHDISWYIRQ